MSTDPKAVTEANKLELSKAMEAFHRTAKEFVGLVDQGKIKAPMRVERVWKLAFDMIPVHFRTLTVIEYDLPGISGYLTNTGEVAFPPYLFTPVSHTGSIEWIGPSSVREITEHLRGAINEAKEAKPRKARKYFRIHRKLAPR